MVRNPRSGGGVPQLDGPRDGLSTMRIKSETKALADFIQECAKSFRNGDRSSRFVAARPELSAELEAVKRACLAVVAAVRRHQVRARLERERRRANAQNNAGNQP